MTARPELDGLSSLQVSEGDKLVNNGEEMDHSLLLEQQEQLTKDLKEGVAVLGKMLGDLKCTNSVSMYASVPLSLCLYTGLSTFSNPSLTLHHSFSVISPCLFHLSLSLSPWPK